MVRKYTCQRCGAAGHGRDDCGTSRNPLSGPIYSGEVLTEKQPGEVRASYVDLHKHYSKLHGSKVDPSGDAENEREISYSSENTGAIKDELRCGACGQFVAADSPHSCWQRKLMKFTPGIQLASTAGLASAVFALGAPAVAIVGAFAVGTLFLKTYVAKKLVSRKPKRERILVQTREVAKIQEMGEQFMQEMGVEGNVEVELAKTGRISKAGPNAGAIRSPSGNHRIIVNEAFLKLPVAEQRAIMAHEVAHLQPENRNIFRLGVRASALPVGLATGAIATSAAGMGALSGGAVAAAAWLAVLLGSTALSRREERRADREAHKTVGGDFPAALKSLSEKSYGSVRGDRPWRIEDLFSTHGNLPNRISDMEKAKR